MILLIDNYDSFSYNLYQLIGEIEPDIKVIRNDEMTVEEIYHKTNIHPLDLNGIMTVLEIKGVVFSAMGKFFVANF